MTNAEYAVFVAALRLELGASWANSPCKYTEVTPPDSGHYVRTPRGHAVQFTVLGRRFVDLNYAFRAEEVASLLRHHGVWTEPSTPNSDRATVFAASV